MNVHLIAKGLDELRVVGLIAVLSEDAEECLARLNGLEMELATKLSV